MADPMYRQIADDLRRQIEAGDLPAGSQLPTELDLCDEYGASRNTVRDAIRLLITRGLVETRPGQGTYVVENIQRFVTTLIEDPETGRGGGEEGVYIAQVEAANRTPRNCALRVEIQQAVGDLAAALQVEDGTYVISRHQQRFIDSAPWSLQTSYYPMSLVNSHGATRLLEATDIPEGSVTYLGEHVGIKQTGYRDKIAVRPPDETEISFFSISADGLVPVFEVFRVGFDQNGNPFRLTVTAYPADRIQFAVNVGEVPT